MNKKIALTFGGIILAIAILSASTVVYFRYKNAPIEAVPVASSEFSIPETSTPEKESSSTPTAVPTFKPEQKAVSLVPVVTESKDIVPPPEVAETEQADGTVVQTPNWKAQKELAPDADLKNHDKEPEYVQPKDSTPKKQTPVSSSSVAEKPKASSTPKEAASSTAPAKAAPKNGAKKTENGANYTYVKGFGWGKDGNGGTTEYISGELSGEKVGH